MRFKEFKKLKTSIKAFFAKSDYESAMQVIDAKLKSNEFFENQYTYNDILIDLYRALNSDTMFYLQGCGLDDEYIFEKIKANPQILHLTNFWGRTEGTDEIELLSQALDCSTQQAEEMLQARDDAFQESKSIVQSCRFEYLKANGVFDTRKQWRQYDLDQIYQPSTFSEKLRYDIHKLSETKKLDKLIELVDSNKITIAEMRNIFGKAHDWIIQEEVNGKYIFHHSGEDLANYPRYDNLPDSILYNAIKIHKNELVDLFARIKTLETTNSNEFYSQKGIQLDNLVPCILYDLTPENHEKMRTLNESFKKIPFKNLGTKYTTPNNDIYLGENFEGNFMDGLDAIRKQALRNAYYKTAQKSTNQQKTNSDYDQIFK